MVYAFIVIFLARSTLVIEYHASFFYILLAWICFEAERIELHDSWRLLRIAIM
jgi:hypothetical protein